MKAFLIAYAIALSACSFEAGGTGSDLPDSERAIRGLQDRRGDHVAVLADSADGKDMAGSGAIEDTNEPDAGSAAVEGPEVDAGSLVEADSGLVETDAGTGDGAAGAAGAGSGTVEPVSPHDGFVGTWKKVADAPRACEASATLDNTPCSEANCAEVGSLSIDAAFALSALVDFVRWDGDVLVGEGMGVGPRFLRLWLVDEDTLLGDYRTEGSSAGTVCRAWRMVRD